MSSSKHQVEAADIPDKTPKCARCRHHGFLVPQKGHARFCRFLDCTCWKCSLSTERSKLGALQRKMRDSEKMNNSPGAGGGTGPRAPLEEAPGSATSSAARVLDLEDDEEMRRADKTYAQLRTARPPEMMDPPVEERFSSSRIQNRPDHHLHRGASPGPPSSPPPPPHVAGLDRDGRDHVQERFHGSLRPQEQDGFLEMNRSHRQAPCFHQLGQSGQREVSFSPAAMPMPMITPMVVLGSCPYGCTPWPGILVNMAPRPCPHGPFYISHFQSAMPYSPASPDGSGLFFSAQPPHVFPAPYQEETNPRSPMKRH